VRDNLETLYGAIEDGALDLRVPAHAKKELEGYLDCGIMCRGFARLRCVDCDESRLVAFACKGRGFCPSCMGRRMCATAANLIEDVLPPEVALRQWVLTFPFPWRRRLAQDGALLGALTRVFVQSVEKLYARRSANGNGKTGAVTVVQRSSSDMRLNPHLHTVVLDGAYQQNGDALTWTELGHIKTRDVGEVLEHAVRRMARYLRRHDLRGLGDGSSADERDDALAASAVSGTTPPAGPSWLRSLPPLRSSELAFDKPLCASLDGFTLHAATRAGALDVIGREALLRYVLRPPLAQERVELLPDGLVRISLKRAYADGTMAVDMDPLSLLSRLAASVPPPRFHTVKYAGVLAAASPWRSRVGPRLVVPDDAPASKKKRGGYRPWAELLKRTFGCDVLACPACGGRMKLVAMLTEPKSVSRFLHALDEPTDVPVRSPSRGPPYWKSTVLRRRALGEVA
jgi:hypothetical protein